MALRVRVGRLLGTVVAAATLLVGCGQAAPEPSAPVTGEPQRGGTLVFGLNTDQPSLDPARCNAQLGFGPCTAVFGTLLRYDQQEQQFQPAMAESFEPSDEGLTWTLRLREGVTFSDGTPYDAAAVVANWERVRDPANLSDQAGLAAEMSWEVLDPRTVEVRLAAPNYQLPWALAESALATIGSPAAMQAGGDTFSRNPVGAGPFTLADWVTGNEIVFARNPGYWDQPRPYLDELVFRLLPAEDVRAQSFAAGELDIYLNYDTRLREQMLADGAQDQTVAVLAGTGIYINHRLVPPPIREALHLLIDNTQIVASVYPGEDVPRTVAQPGTPYYADAPTFPAPDVARAQQLVDAHLAATGQESVTLPYQFYAGVTTFKTVGELLQAQAQQVRGLHIELRSTDTAAQAADQAAGRMVLGTYGIIGANPDLLYRLYHSQSPGNTNGYADPRFDELVETARTDPDPDVRDAAFRDAFAQLSLDPPLRIYRHYLTHLLHQPYVHDVVASDTAGFRPELVWMTEQ